MSDQKNGNEDKPGNNQGFDYVLAALIFVASFVAGSIPSKGDPERDTNSTNNEIARWTRVVGVWTRILAGVGVVTTAVLFLQFCTLHNTDKTTREALIAANRGWIAPLRVELTAGVDDPNGPSVIIHYQNVGHSPARDVRIGMGPIAVDVSEPISLTREFPKTPLWEPLGNTFRETCNKNDPTSGMGAVYPSATTESFAPSRMTTTWDKGKLLAGTQMIVVTACFTYRTMDIIGHSGFCSYIFHVAGQSPQSWETRLCPVANYAE